MLTTLCFQGVSKGAKDYLHNQKMKRRKNKPNIMYSIEMYNNWRKRFICRFSSPTDKHICWWAEYWPAIFYLRWLWFHFYNSWSNSTILIMDQLMVINTYRSISQLYNNEMSPEMLTSNASRLTFKVKIWVKMFKSQTLGWNFKWDGRKSVFKVNGVFKE